jgi:putative SOS response-associated peptidase YedK
MCGRYTRRREWGAIQDELEAEADAQIQLEPSFNVAPGQDCLALVGPKARKLEVMRWGLVPSWSKSDSGFASRINACAETLTERSSYKPILARGRCLIPADGFYEWEKPFKQPFLFRLKNNETFVFAGLCDAWEKPDGSVLKTFTIITTSPNELVAKVHDRMPAILRREDIGAWLDPDTLIATMLGMLKPYPADEMESAPVRPLVNSVKNNGPRLVDPIVLPRRALQAEFNW